MPETKTISENPWDIYPRPLLRRESFFSLNGEWELTIRQDTPVPVRVPFCIESELSGVKKRVETGAAVLYRKTFRLPDGFVKGRVLLHFGAVDQIARVVVNDRFLGSHEGGYTAFGFDITAALFPDRENTILVFIEDYLALHTLPWGKQKEKNGGMWYTPVTGIWQTVWLESVPMKYIPQLKIRTKGARVQIDLVEDPGLITGNTGKETNRPADASGFRLLPMSGHIVYHDGQETITVPLKKGHAEFTVSCPRFWSPADPYLYEFSLSSGADTVQSYFALRDISVETIDGIPRILLNGKPAFFHGVLDQGYFEKGIYTPESPADFEKDLQLLKDCGFNMLRKHIKVEPEIFYYACDKMGLLVFQDMVNCGNYHFFRDTVLPTATGGRIASDRRLNRNEKARQNFEKAMKETVLQLGNHPCIVYWTIFNEGWGQFSASEMYEKLRAIDDTRLIDSASGWFHTKDLKTDVESRHVYFRAAKPVRSSKPYVLSEYGGYALKIDGHAYRPDKTYGYKGHKTKEELMNNLTVLFRRDVIGAIPEGLSAAVYTQLSDVEDEVNGLVTYDREVVKVDTAAMKALSEEIDRAMAKVTGAVSDSSHASPAEKSGSETSFTAENAGSDAAFTADDAGSEDAFTGKEDRNE